MKPLRLWPGMVFGLIGLNVSVVAVTLYLAHSDASFAVEPDYYQKALAWDESTRIAAQSADLGWKAVLEVSPSGPAREPWVSLRLTDRQGVPVADARVEVTAFASARASERRKITLREVAPGLYSAALAGAQAGAWEFAISADKGADRFQKNIETSIAAAPEGRP